MGLLGWARVARRLVLLALLLAGCLLGHGVHRSIRRTSPWPRRFLMAAARVAGVRVTLRGTPSQAPALLLANHVSWIDILALGGATGTAFVAHDGLAAQPLVGWLCRLNRTLFIARQARGGAGQQATRLRSALSDRSCVLTLFPEGTTGDGRVPGRFKSALLAAVDPPPVGLPIQPVWIDYGAHTREIAWVGDERGLANFARVLGRAGSVPLTLHFLAPLGGAALASRKAIARAAHDGIVAASAVLP